MPRRDTRCILIPVRRNCEWLIHSNWLLTAGAICDQTFAKSKVDWTSVATNEDFSKALLMLFKQRGYKPKAKVKKL